MATKKPSTITQLKQVLERAKQLEAENEKIKKELDTAKQHKEMYSKRADDHAAEIEQIHALLDVLPGAAARKTEADHSWDQKNITAMTRLAAYLANRNTGVTHGL